MKTILSKDLRYRYTLVRFVQDNGPVYAYFGINCSHANEVQDDQTVRKLIGFTREFGGHSFVIGNPFAFRSTDVKKLATCDDPVGPENKKYLKKIIEYADILVPCWGNLSKIPAPLRPQVYELLGLLKASGKPLRTFGLTKSGDPKHPLMLSYSTKLVAL